MARLTDDQLYNVISVHLMDGIEQMTLEELKDLALEQRRSEYLAPDRKIDQNAVLEELCTRYDGDTDLVREFIHNRCLDCADVTPETLDAVIGEFMA